jgi:hypothetical protein
LSLMSFQMIRVISSPSSSTTGFATLIFAMVLPCALEVRRDAPAPMRASADGRAL